MLQEIAASARKEVTEVVHERALLLVIIAFPIITTILVGMTMRDLRISGVTVAITGLDASEFSTNLVSSLNSSDAFIVRELPDEETGWQMFRNNEIRALIIIPPDFESSLTSGQGAAISIVYDNAAGTLLKPTMKLALLGAVQAASTNITKSYIYSAWGDLERLNTSGSGLRVKVRESKGEMLATSERLKGIQENISQLRLSEMTESINEMAALLDGFTATLDSNRATLTDLSSASDIYVINRTISSALSETELFLQNASLAINQTEQKLANSSNRLTTEKQKLNQTHTSLQASIAAMPAIRASVDNSYCRPAVPAIDILTNTLKETDQRTLEQMKAMDDELAEIRALNTTVQSTKAQLASFRIELASLNSSLNSQQQNALGNLNANLAKLEASFRDASRNVNTAKAELAKTRQGVDNLRQLISSVNETLAGTDKTIGDALAETESIEDLIDSLQETVEVQTSKDPARIAQPLVPEFSDRYKLGSQVQTTTPAIIAITLLFTQLLVASISLVREKARKTIVRSLLIPSGFANLVLGKIILLLLTSLLQLILILATASLVFSISLPQDITQLLLATIISSLAFCLLGMLIGLLSRAEGAAIQGSLILAVPMIFLGGIFLPTEMLPSSIQILQKLLPLSYVTETFHKLITTGGDPSPQLIFLLFYSLLLALPLALIVMKRRDIRHYT